MGFNVGSAITSLFTNPIDYGVPDTAPPGSFKSPLPDDGPILPAPVASRVGSALRLASGIGETVGGLGLAFIAPGTGPLAIPLALTGGAAMTDGVARMTHAAGNLWNGIQTESPISLAAQQLFGVTPAQGQTIDAATSSILTLPSAGLGTYSLVTSPSRVVKTLGTVGGVTSLDNSVGNVVSAINGTDSPSLLARGLTSLGVPDEAARFGVAGLSLIAPVGLAANAIRNRFGGQSLDRLAATPTEPDIKPLGTTVQRGFFSTEDGKNRLFTIYPPRAMGDGARRDFLLAVDPTDSLNQTQVHRYLAALDDGHSFLVRRIWPVQRNIHSNLLNPITTADLAAERMAGISGGRVLADFDGLSYRNNAALQQFGAKLDPMGNPLRAQIGDTTRTLPNVPPRTALLDHLFYDVDDPLGDKVAIQFGLDLAKALKQDSVVSYLNSGPLLLHLQRNSPAPLAINFARAQPGAPDAIWQGWARMVMPNEQLPATWPEAFKKGLDRTLLAAAQDHPEAHLFDSTTGMSEFERLTHNLGYLYKNNPVSVLDRLPMKDKLLFDDGFLFGSQWNLRPSAWDKANEAFTRLGQSLNPNR